MADSFSANVVAAFPFDQDALGPHGCYDYSPNKLGLTWSSPGAGLSDVQSKFGGISCYFDGSGYVSYPVNPAIGTGVFTFEAWVYPTTIAAGYAAIVSFVTGTLYRYGATFIWHQGGSRIATATITADAWYHVAIVRSAGVISLYLNGVAVATTYATAYDFSSLTH